MAAPSGRQAALALGALSQMPRRKKEVKNATVRCILKRASAQRGSGCVGAFVVTQLFASPPPPKPEQHFSISFVLLRPKIGACDRSTVCRPCPSEKARKETFDTLAGGSAWPQACTIPANDPKQSLWAASPCKWGCSRLNLDLPSRIPTTFEDRLWQKPTHTVLRSPSFGSVTSRAKLGRQERATGAWMYERHCNGLGEGKRKGRSEVQSLAEAKRWDVTVVAACCGFGAASTFA